MQYEIILAKKADLRRVAIDTTTVPGIHFKNYILCMRKASGMLRDKRDGGTWSFSRKNQITFMAWRY